MSSPPLQARLQNVASGIHPPGLLGEHETGDDGRPADCASDDDTDGGGRDSGDEEGGMGGGRKGGEEGSAREKR